MTHSNKPKRSRVSSKPKPPPRNKMGLDPLEMKNSKKAAEIRNAIKHFLSGSIGKQTKGAISPSRFRNLCKRHSALLPGVLESLNDADRAKIEKILAGGRHPGPRSR